MQEHISEIKNLDAEVIAISTTGNQKDVEKSKKVLEITYNLIPTPNGKIAKEYGLRYDSFGAAYATIILDKKGQILFKSVEEYATRTSASRIIKELKIIQ